MDNLLCLFSYKMSGFIIRFLSGITQREVGDWFNIIWQLKNLFTLPGVKITDPACSKTLFCGRQGQMVN
jgi:hypothetical protein